MFFSILSNYFDDDSQRLRSLLNVEMLKKVLDSIFRHADVEEMRRARVCRRKFRHARLTKRRPVDQRAQIEDVIFPTITLARGRKYSRIGVSLVNRKLICCASRYVFISCVRRSWGVRTRWNALRRNPRVFEHVQTSTEIGPLSKHDDELFRDTFFFRFSRFFFSFLLALSSCFERIVYHTRERVNHSATRIGIKRTTL